MDVVVPRDEHPGVVIGTGVATGAVTVGTVGTVAATLPIKVGAVGVGSSVAELTPRLPISVESRGIPVLGLPPGVIGVVELGLEDAAMLLEPEPHMPDMPAVSSVPELELCVIPDIVDMDVAAIPEDMSIDAAVVPTAAPVAGDDPAIAVPPPSKVDVEPNIPLGETPSVEHPMPVEGVAMLPVTIGAGLMPADGSSVAPRPIPSGVIGDPVLVPSGEVVPTVGVGRAIPVTCASAPPPAKKARQAAMKRYLTGVLHCRRSWCTEPVDRRTHALAVLHDHRVDPVFHGSNPNRNKLKDPPKRVHLSLPDAGAARRLAANAQTCFGKLASTLSSVIG